MKSFVNSHFRRSKFRAVLGLLIGLSVLTASIDASATLTPSSRAILDEAMQADAGGERGSDEALAKLKKRPRAEVLSAFRDGLTHGGPWTSIAARGARALDAKELIPDLVKAAQKTDDWPLLASLEQLSRGASDRPAVEALFAKKMETASSASKIVMLEAFSSPKAQLPSSIFDSLLVDKNLGVRRALVSHFLANREAYPVEEQVRRFKLAFKMKPYQGRLEALIYFGALPSEQRRSIASAFDPSLCVKESNADVKSACDQVAKGAK
jgi:hypothetical protein